MARKAPFDHERMTQSQAAEIMGCDRRTLRRWEAWEAPIPRNRDGTYHAHALIWWAVANKIRGVDRSQQLAARSRRRW